MRYPPAPTKSNIIKKAASYARCELLSRLDVAIENKKTISTRKVRRILEDIEDDLRLDAGFLRKIADIIDD